MSEAETKPRPPDSPSRSAEKEGQERGCFPVPHESRGHRTHDLTLPTRTLRTLHVLLKVWHLSLNDTFPVTFCLPQHHSYQLEHLALVRFPSRGT